MNIFRYFDSLLSRKHSLLALTYSDNMEESLRKVFYEMCYKKNEPIESFPCSECRYSFAKRYITRADGLDLFKGNLICRRCLLKNEKMLCERCGKCHIVSEDYIYVHHPVLHFSSIEKAIQVFPDRDIKSDRVALDSEEFSKLYKDIGFPEYARRFQHGAMLCQCCLQDLYYISTEVNNSVYYKLQELGCELDFPRFSKILNGDFNNSGLDADVYTSKVHQHVEELSTRLHNLDMKLLKGIRKYSHSDMKGGLDSTQQARFMNSQNNSQGCQNIDTPIDMAKQMLLVGVKNSVKEFAYALVFKLNDVTAEDIVVECTPLNCGCEAIVIIPTEDTLDKELVKKLFYRYVIERPIDHPYGMSWQRIKKSQMLNYAPSLSLDNFDVEMDEGNISIMAKVKFKFK